MIPLLPHYYHSSVVVVYINPLLYLTILQDNHRGTRSKYDITTLTRFTETHITTFVYQKYNWFIYKMAAIKLPLYIRVGFDNLTYYLGIQDYTMLASVVPLVHSRCRLSEFVVLVQVLIY